jgi:coproporphyrinogen III oxidase-like Fe-S oxidoreductase
MTEAMSGRAVSQEQMVAVTELPFEFMLNALRLKHGIDLAKFTERCGLPLSAIEPGLRRAEAKGLVERDFARVKPTARGLDFLSNLQELFLPEAA